MSVIFALNGCTSPAIYEDAHFNPPVYWGSHSVETGDTLYSIAWRYGRDYEELAELNNIAAPYKIFPGQKISLIVPDDYIKKARQVTDYSSVVKKTTVIVPTTKVHPPADNKNIQRPETGGYKTQRTKAVKWSWPHSGPIIDSFTVTGKINKGVDIAGKKGDPVRAAAGGEVVYAGNGLLGYGNLVIVNHNESFLSAYAHNSRIVVREGEIIKPGQKIAELGDSGSKTVKLHFEIRKNGKPVDPLIFLPKRSK